MRLLVIFFLVALAVSPTGQAAELDDSSKWSSSSHLGFGIEDQSSTQFENVAGSLVFFDFARALFAGTELGFRTVMSGGHVPGSSFYRLSAGPLVNFEVADDWWLQAMAGVFQESASHKSGESLYQSRGQILMLGWEKLFRLHPRVLLAWGGFYSFHQGGLDRLNASLYQPQIQDESQLRNNGRTRGVEVALRILL